MNATLTYNSGAGTYTYTPSPGTSYTYNSTTGALKSVADAAGNTLTLTAASPAPGAGHCPATAASCTTITAASGRTLVLGFNSAGLVTSVTDPLARRWAYAYTGSQLTTVTDPLSNVTTYTYGAGSTGNPQLANDLLTVTAPNGQTGGSAAGKKTVNVYDAQGRVTTQTDPMGFATTFNYCTSAAVGNCLNPATGTGLVTVTDPDGNTTVYDYQQGTLAATSQFTGTTLTSETDQQPNTTSGTLLASLSADGNGNLTTDTYSAAGNLTQENAPSATGTATTTFAYPTAAATADLANCASTPAATATCQAASPPTPVTPGGTITPPSAAPPVGTTYTLYDTDGNQLYATTGVYQPGAGTASYSQTTYQLFKGNSVTLSGTTTNCATVPPSQSLPCAKINADGKVTQLAYDTAGDLTSSATPDGNGTEVATTTYAYNGDGEQTSMVAPDGNLTGANIGNYTAVTAYNNDDQKTTVTQAGGTGATATPRVTTYGYDPDPDKTRIIYCRDSRRRQRWDGPVSFDFLGYAFRPRDTLGKNGKFTGFDLAVSPKAVKRMSETVTGWRLHRLTNLTWEQLAGWIGPVIRGWMAYYGRFRRSELFPLLARINYHVQRWIRAKYRRLRPFKAMVRAWNRVTAQIPGLLPHWRWEAMARY